ncbi:helix-turn-helix domain-containing protein [Streptacidiphilus jiangxiensis]|uniref:Sugar-specific transcriptional regulator TrmB n=1 Tax=Streptacidiphilus jiangxiensis TaxID=235985 RepID=A0A1H7L4F6_STRJI|nr:helix-turn-helix domain-containing protein [Streptacidiphilus jiangxiensis]SEK93704.1 Sugar-specific transcriptional regulator TrmB [Streptacidiphilus jiangxiensis]
MLDSIGLDDVAERAYEILLHQESATPAAMADELGVSPQRARRTLDTLTADGLAERLPGRTPRYVPVDPRAGLSALIRSHQAGLERVASAVDTYAARYHERTLRTDPHRLVEVIAGPAEITHRVQELIAGAQHEILAFDAPPYVTPHRSASEIEHPVLARGVSVRAIYATEVLTVPVLADRLRAMVGLGERARVMPRVPMKMVLVDRSDAMLPLTASEEGLRSTAVFVRRSTLCDALVELFEANWATATPIFTEAPPTDEVSAEDRALLHLLNSGLKDDAIARQLGLSDRTLRRRLAELTSRLGATSRFQAGTQAMRRGWL